MVLATLFTYFYYINKLPVLLIAHLGRGGYIEVIFQNKEDFADLF
jgi:hypothetical protein